MRSDKVSNPMPSNSETPPVEALIQLATGYWASQATGCAARLGVADQLAQGPRTAAEIAPALHCHPDSLHRLMRACASVGLFDQDGEGRFALTPTGELLRSDLPISFRGLLAAQTAPGHWLPWGRLDEAVRSGQRQTTRTLGMEIWDFYAKTPEEGKWFSEGMSALSLMAISEVLRVHDFSRVRELVDVGGAFGALAAEILKAHPQVRGIVLDSASVTPGAREAIAAQGLSSRCEVVAGDFFKGVPAGKDLYLLKNILHDWSDEECVTILGHCEKALASDGAVVVVEMLVGEPGGPKPTLAPPMDLNMLVMLPGRERTEAQFAELFARAGLKLVKVSPTYTPFAVLEARRGSVGPTKKGMP